MRPLHIQSFVAACTAQTAFFGSECGDINKLVATDIKTLPYPGFPTDMQAQMMAMMVISEGRSKVQETIFENRFMHAAELSRMGANIEVNGRMATIPGNIYQLKGTRVVSTDLRAGAALVLAGLVAEGKTEVTEIYHVERGYEDLVGRLQGLGAHIEKVDVE